ncbi:MAG: alpha/beta hydrolase [bacterium]
MLERRIKVARTARYFELGTIGPGLREIWFVCHGYGQLAAYFMQQFEGLSDSSRLIVAPEGLSRFYLNGVSGRIGASWMTAEERLGEIEDYVTYLDAVYDEVVQQVDRAAVKVVVLGFSQGAATVCRWLVQGKARADRLVLWAGLMPREQVTEPLDLTPFRELSLTVVAGRHDEYVTKEILSKQKAFLVEKRIPHRIIEFDGGHELRADLLKQIAENET